MIQLKIEVMASVRVLFIDLMFSVDLSLMTKTSKNGIAMSVLGASCLKKEAELATET
jgi:hypothetical protein